MIPNLKNYAGMEIASGRRPVTLAVLDSDLNVAAVQQCKVIEAVSILDEYNAVKLSINIPGSKLGQGIYSDLKKKLKAAGFVPHSKNEGDRKWTETDAQECYRAIRPRLFPRRALEGRIQRALILYEEGLRIPDPMDFFEEITRHKLLLGSLPDENIYSVKQLDALVAAFVSWLADHRPHKLESQGDLVLPKYTDNE